MVLYDNIPSRMPKVWVQERFTPQPPPGMGWNGTTGFTWVTGGKTPFSLRGTFYDYIATDDVTIPWTSFYADPQDDPIYGWLAHSYYAGTSSTTSGGVFVGRWTTGHWHDATYHEKNP
ncbi:MAG: hypothetical protein IH851_10150 [Armatimonadetes bacterium]|nr:hypothetical protein [Armatimonadota bacterium]